MLDIATPWLLLVLVAGAGATWVAGTRLSPLTDALDARFGLGAELGGIVLLAVAGTLPELAITVAAAAQGDLSLAAGNLIGGIAVQTMVLVICDIAAGPERPLTFLVGALTPVLEGMLVVMLVAAVLMGALLPRSAAIGGVVSPASLAIVILWIAGVAGIDRARKQPRWSVTMPGSRPGRRPAERRAEPAHRYAKSPTASVIGYFLAASIVTLIAGAALELSSEALATRSGVNGVIFGATVLATATALPEISSGYAAVRLGDNALAIGDIFGGNAFQLCLFLLADLIAGSPLLPTAGRLNSWLGALGIALTAVYSVGVVARPYRCFARLGPDSIIAIVVFAAGIVGLALLPR
jgi:cation:H+ antiporter